MDDFDELLEAGICECGVPFSEHPPLERIRVASWHSERSLDQPWRNTVTGKVLTERQRATFGLGEHFRPVDRVCARPACGKKIPATRRRHAKYCGDECQILANRDAWLDRQRANRRAARVA